MLTIARVCLQMFHVFFTFRMHCSPATAFCLEEDEEEAGGGENDEQDRTR